MDNCCFLNPDSNDHDFMDDTEIDVGTNGTETHHQDSTDSRTGNNFSNTDDSKCISSNDNEKSEKFKNPLINVSIDQVSIQIKTGLCIIIFLY